MAAGASPAMVVRVAANLAELKKNLQEGKDLIETTTAGMQKLAASFSGDRLAQQAHNVVAAVHQIGGASRLTEAEQARVNATLERAIEKYRVLGKEAPAAMLALFEATKKTAAMTDQQAGRITVTAAEMRKAGFATNDWQRSLSSFDSVLASVGFNVGTQIRAIGELRAAYGHTVTTLGLLGTAGLAAGVALAGWQTGRLIADMLGLDKVIGDSAARLLNWGDVAAETAAARADALARASQRAGREIRDMSEAIRVNNQWMEDWLLTTGRSRDAAADSAAMIASWREEIRQVAERGDLPSLTADLESQAFSLDVLSTRYGVHTEALQNYARELKASREAAAELAQERIDQLRIIDEAMKVLTDTTATMWRRSLELNRENNEELRRTSQLYLEIANNAVIANLKAKETLNARQGFDLQGNALPQAGSLEAMTAAFNQQLAALQANTPPGIDNRAQVELLFQQFQEAFLTAATAAEQVGAAHEDAAQKATDAGERINGLGGGALLVGDVFGRTAGIITQAGVTIQGMLQSAHGVPGGSIWADRSASPFRMFEAKINDFLNMAAAYGRAGIFVGGGPVPHRASGGPVDSGMPYYVGERGPELFVPKSAGTVLPHGASGPSVNVAPGAVVIHGALLKDAQSSRELAELVGEAIWRLAKK